MKNANATITISFKKDEMWLYDLLKSKHSSAGSAIKDMLKEQLSKESKSNEESNTHRPIDIF